MRILRAGARSFSKARRKYKELGNSLVTLYSSMQKGRASCSNKPGAFCVLDFSHSCSVSYLSCRCVYCRSLSTATSCCRFIFPMQSSRVTTSSFYVFNLPHRMLTVCKQIPSTESAPFFSMGVRNSLNVKIVSQAVDYAGWGTFVADLIVALNFALSILTLSRAR